MDLLPNLAMAAIVLLFALGGLTCVANTRKKPVPVRVTVKRK